MYFLSYLAGLLIAGSGLLIKNPAVTIFGLFVMIAVFINAYVDEREANGE